jgi:hypothetical protein
LKMLWMESWELWLKLFYDSNVKSCVT